MYIYLILSLGFRLKTAKKKQKNPEYVIENFVPGHFLKKIKKNGVGYCRVAWFWSVKGSKCAHPILNDKPYH